MNERASETPYVPTLDSARPSRALLAAVVVSLACAPWSWIVDGLTPSWVVYPVVLSVGLWRIRKGKGALLLGIAATVFLVVHLPWAWSALTGERAGSIPDDLAVHRFVWAVTLFVVPLLTAVAGFAAWREVVHENERARRDRGLAPDSTMRHPARSPGAERNLP